MNPNDRRHMRHALSMAARGLGRVWPWPSVGCVLVRDDRIVGHGNSDDQTLRHAEVVALEQAGEKARGATAYVTLEPCSHHGRTPPCADALIKAGITRVVAAMKDPNPKVSGEGFRSLEAAGIGVEIGLCSAEAEEQNKGFLIQIRSGRPMVTLKLATTLDGRIATASGESRWITGPSARRMVHAQRMGHDAVLIGGGTARVDDPILTVRDMGVDRQPVRIVVSRHIRLSHDCRLFNDAGNSPVWIVCGEDAAETKEANQWREAGAKVIPAHTENGQISAAAMLASLGQAGLTRVLCEGGGMVAASLLTADLVDELVVFSAGKVIGAEGQPSIGPLGLAELGAAPMFELIETRPVGVDVLQRWTRAASAT
ncbi:MAG: bifunctional diaminohydroxyphosphoribosylaminopyrimidine deaminase/5-amino-6-(5-phosphoribosylamino)uracil reductase RibD [Boseongicola sp.]